jgi:hypothetical protein
MTTARATQLVEASGFTFLGHQACPVNSNDCTIFHVQSKKGEHKIYMYVVPSRRCKRLGTTPAAVPGVGAEGKDAGQGSRCFGRSTTLYRAKQDHTLVLGEAGYYTASFAYAYQVMHENRWAKFAGIAFTRAELDVPNTGQTQTIKS